MLCDIGYTMYWLLNLFTQTSFSWPAESATLPSSDHINQICHLMDGTVVTCSSVSKNIRKWRLRTYASIMYVQRDTWFKTSFSTQKQPMPVKSTNYFVGEREQWCGICSSTEGICSSTEGKGGHAKTNSLKFTFQYALLLHVFLLK